MSSAEVFTEGGSISRLDHAIDVLFSYRGSGSIPPLPIGETSQRVRTEFSATLFSGDPQQWIRYLSSSTRARYEAEMAGTVEFCRSGIRVEPDNVGSVWFCQILSTALGRFWEASRDRSNVAQVVAEMCSGVAIPSQAVRVFLSRSLPTAATLELAVGGDREPARLVLNRGLMLALRDALGCDGLMPEDEWGLTWPLLIQVVGLLAFQPTARDGYAAKIDVVARLVYVAVNLLYESERDGELIANRRGEAVERVIAATSGRSRKEARSRDAYLRLLRRGGFTLRAKPYGEYSTDLQIAAREYLDTRYMRLSLAGAMPDLELWQRPMQVDLSRRKPRTPKPKVGLYGAIDMDDVHAWSEVTKPLQELGFTLVRQLGVGDFGRVYEAHNYGNPVYPERVAIKVDKILGKKKKAILEAELAMQVGRELACASHLIRLYDTGKLEGRRFTYHVLQLIDGETVDGLVGALEVEHHSLGAPPERRSSLLELQREWVARVGWGGATSKSSYPGAVRFRFGLSPAMLMDLLTGMLMCLEQVHGLGYAMNDLKNDNMMVSRRGQVKGIDLDSFSRIHSPLDKYTDFVFLATSLMLVVLHAPRPKADQVIGDWQHLIHDEAKLRQAIATAWTGEAVEELSAGRVRQEELVLVLTNLVLRSKRLDYANDPSAFSQDITRLVDVKRRLLAEDLVID